VEIDHKNTITAEDQEFLDFKLTDKELLELGRGLSSKHRELKRLENEKKDSAEHFKNLIGGVNAEIDKSNRLIETGIECREVDCIIKKDYGNKKIHYVHDGIVKKTVDMNDYEFKNRPSHILPEKKEEAADESQQTEEMSDEEVKSRQDEIATKEAANQVPSGDVKAQTEAKSEESVLNSAVMSQ
jgi:hypothetical protein